MLRSIAIVTLLSTGTLLCCEAAARAAPPVPDGRSDLPPSPDYRVERRSNGWLILAGSLVLGTAHLGIVIPSLIIAANGTPSAAVVTIPIGGPLWYAPKSGTIGGLAVFDALVQAAGAGMLIGGIVGKRVLVPAGTPTSAARLLPVPLLFGRTGAGASVVGVF